MKKLFYTTIVIGVIIGCSKQSAIEPVIETNIAEYSSIADDIALDLARRLALNLKKPEVKQFLKLEVNAQFDGDYNFLFLNAKDKTIINGNGESVSFLNLLYKDETTNGRKAGSNLIEQIEKEYPLLQIAIPELETTSPENWDIENYTPTIAVVPTSYTEDSGTNRILAFDSDGNEYYLDTKNEPNNLVIIISANERLKGFKKTTNARFEVPCLEMYATPALVTNNAVFYHRDDVNLYRFDDRCEPPGDDNPPRDDNPPPAGCQLECDRDCKTTQEKLFKLKFVNMSQLRSVEDWIAGKIELRIAMVYATTNNAAYFDTAYTGKRRDFRTCNIWANCTPIWKTSNRLFTEFETDYGNKIKVAMYEEDGNFPFGIGTTTAVWVTTTINGEIYNYKVDIEIDDLFQDLGDVEIQYCDKANAPGKWYTNDFIEFYWGQN